MVKSVMMAVADEKQLSTMACERSKQNMEDGEEAEDKEWLSVELLRANEPFSEEISLGK